MSGGGVYMYRAVAECSACGKVVDVGPFDSMVSGIDAQLPGWLLQAAHPPSFVLSDAFGTRFTLCPECMGRPVKEVLAAITERHVPLA